MSNSNEISKQRFERLANLPLNSVVPNKSGFTGYKAARSVWASRSLLFMFINRDLKGKYKDSFVGVLWTLVRPLVQLFVFYLVIGKFLGAERGIPQFAIFIFAGLTAWGLFAEIINSTTSSVIANSGIVKKIYLPREIFPLAAVGVSVFNFAIQLLILIVATLILRPGISINNLTYAVPSFLLILIFSTAIGLGLSAINVFLRDTQYLVEVSLMVLIWASPIMYSWSMAKQTIGDNIGMVIYGMNPITLAVMGFQKAFWDSSYTPVGTFPNGLWEMLWIALGLSALVLVLFQRIFVKLQGNFAQVL